MTFDECLEELKSESAEAKEILEQAEIFAKLCNEYGVEVKDGTGRILRNGKEIDIVSEIKDAFPRPKMDAVEFLQQYKSMCGQYNCADGCPIKQLRNNYDVDVCDDAFIYLHPEEVVEAVLRWRNEDNL